MGQITLAGNPPIAITLRRSARARRLTLRISQLDGRVTLTLPKAVAEADGMAFLLAKETWLRRHIAQQSGPVAVRIGAHLPVEGELHEIRAGTGRSVRRAEGVLWVPGPEPQAAARLKGWLRARARDRLSEAADRYADRLGRPYDRITLRDTRSRWGSCTHDGGLMFSWRLILGHAEVLDYVAAHEVAHLRHMDHSPQFWKQVETLYGDWRAPRKWLRSHGAELHRYRFD